MYRQVNDFLIDWHQSVKGASKAIQSITDDKIDFAIVQDHNTLGWIANHLTELGLVFGEWLQLDVPKFDGAKSTVLELTESYNKMAEAISEKVANLTDDDLFEEVNAFGKPMLRGNVLKILVQHQIHHVGQMTVLLRQAGLRVPPVMGITKEMAAKQKQ